MSRRKKIILGTIGGLVAICLFCLGLGAVLEIVSPSTPTAVSFKGAMLTAEISDLPTNTIIPTNTTTPTDTPSPSPTLTDTATPPAIGAECIPDVLPEIATVSHVMDGDTIEVEIDGNVYTLRYIGMDTPENKNQLEYVGPDAFAKNTELVEGKNVLLFKDVSETDQFDRLLRYVIADGLFINYELIRTGFARAVTYPPDVACQATFHQAEQVAKAAIVGLWASTPTSIPTEIPLTKAPSTNTPASASKPTKTSKPSKNCDPSYPDVCIPPKPPDLDCPDIPFRRFRVLPPDPHNFDGDHDGIGCES